MVRDNQPHRARRRRTRPIDPADLQDPTPGSWGARWNEEQSPDLTWTAIANRIGLGLLILGVVLAVAGAGSAPDDYTLGEGPVPGGLVALFLGLLTAALGLVVLLVVAVVAVVRWLRSLKKR